jgi:hypothetical protein
MDYYSRSGNRYSFSYKELKEKYEEIVNMTNKEFLNSLPSILHFACFVSFIKEIPSYNLLDDEGIIHELVHLLDIPECCNKNLKSIRKTFKEQLKLS